MEPNGQLKQKMCIFVIYSSTFTERLQESVFLFERESLTLLGAPYMFPLMETLAIISRLC